MQSIQARLAVGLVSVLVVLFGVQWFVVSYAIEHLTDEYLHTQLKHDAENILAAIVIGPGGELSLPLVRVPAVYLRPFSGHYFQIESKGRVIRSRSLWDQALNLTSAKHSQRNKNYIIGPLDQELMLQVNLFEKQDQKIIVATAHEMSDLKEDVHKLQLVYGGISAGALFLLILLQMVIISRGFYPAERLLQQLQAMERGEIAQLTEKAPTEFEPLVNEINHLVELMGKRIQRSRNALGNLAHALKAPLTIVTQVANSSLLRQDQSVRKQLLDQSESMRRLVERELKRARLAGSASPGKRLNLAEDIPPMVEMFEAVYRQKDIAFDIDYPQKVATPVDREDLMELLGNLMDNACKWAKRLVSLTLDVKNNALFIQVEDDGPGVPPDKLNQLVQRGVRVDESTAGHGLGLAIVKDAVTQYQGDLRLSRSERLGGLRVQIIIPFARTPVNT